MSPASSILDLIGNTPLVELTKFDTGPCRLFLKLEGWNPSGSVKDRTALAMINAAEKSGKLKPGGTIIEATAGNTGLGLSLVAAIRGYKVILVVPDKFSEMKITHCEGLGAKVIRTRASVPSDSPEYYVNMAKRIAAETGAYHTNQFDNPANVHVHETTTGPEIWEQMDKKIDAVVCGVGSGGTLAGLGKFFAKVSPQTELILSDPKGALLAAQVNGEKAEAHPFRVEGIGQDCAPGNLDLKINRQGLHHRRRGKLFHRPRTLETRRHPRRNADRHGAGGRAALLPRTENTQARRHLHVRPRRQISSENLWRTEMSKKKKKKKKTQDFSTRCIHGGQSVDAETGAVSVPIYATSTYAQSAPGEHKGFVYARGHNPTRFAFERCIADLEDGSNGFAFASGLAATCAVLDLLPHGSHIIACDDVYGGTYRLFERIKKDSSKLDVTYVDLTVPGALEKAISPNTEMIWVETPTNPLLKIIDLNAVAAVAKKKKILSVCDNTFATPYLQKPLNFGFDIVLHSITKYIGGHSDIIGGAVVVNDPDLAEKLKFIQNATGGILSPFDSFLALRGVKTLDVRMERACASAAKIAEFLHGHKKIAKIYYPGITTHPQYKIAAKADERVRRHDLRERQRRSQSLEENALRLQNFYARRKLGRRRKPDRTPGHHDPRFYPKSRTRKTRHR
jgi:cystathionine gamma-lyase